MAFHSVDDSGNIIETDILVTGYIRQDIEKHIDQQVPDELKRLCFDYWFFNACDSWSSQYHTNDMIEISKDAAEIRIKHPKNILYEDKGITVYGNHVVVDGTSYEWTIKMKKFGWDGTSFESQYAEWDNPKIGIIENDDGMLKACAQTSEWATHGYGYAIIGHAGYPRSLKDNSWNLHDRYLEKGIKFNEDDDVICVHLDLVNHTLGYKINDKYWDTFHDISQMIIDLLFLLLSVKMNPSCNLCN